MKLLGLTSYLTVSTAAFTPVKIFPAFNHAKMLAHRSSTTGSVNEWIPSEISSVPLTGPDSPVPAYVPSIAPTTITTPSEDSTRRATFSDTTAILKLVNHSNLRIRTTDDIEKVIREKSGIVSTDPVDGRIVAYMEERLVEGHEECVEFFKEEYNLNFDYQKGDLVVCWGGLITEENYVSDGHPWWQKIMRYLGSDSSYSKNRLLQAHAMGRRVILTWNNLDKDSGVHKIGEMCTRSIFGSRKKTPRKDTEIVPHVMTDGSERACYMGIIYVDPSKSTLNK